MSLCSKVRSLHRGYSSAACGQRVDARRNICLALGETNGCSVRNREAVSDHTLREQPLCAGKMFSVAQFRLLMQNPNVLTINLH